MSVRGQPCLILTASPLRQSFHELFIDVAPAPLLIRLERLDDRMTARAEVLRRVLISRAIATADVPARHTESQVHPSVARLQTVFAAARARRHVAYLIQMRASHLSPPRENGRASRALSQRCFAPVLFLLCDFAAALLCFCCRCSNSFMISLKYSRQRRTNVCMTGG
jgi:hypothetical protein